MLECWDDGELIAKAGFSGDGYWLTVKDGKQYVHTPYILTKYDYTLMLIHFSQAVDKHALQKAKEMHD